MSRFHGEFAFQFVIHLANHYSVRDLIRLAKLGPNYEEAIELLAREVVPALR